MTGQRGVIAVGVDGTSTGAAALAWAVEVAVRRHAPLHLVHAPADPGRGEPDERDLLRAPGMLDDAEDRALAAGVPSVSWTLSQRAPGPLLVEASETAALLVVGTRGHGMVLGPYGGSVGRHVTRYAHCPVAVVPEGHAPGCGLVVVSLHGAPADRSALRFAFAHAAAAGLGVEALHAWQEPPPDQFEFSALADDRVGRHIQASEIMLAEQLAGYGAQYPDVKITRLSVPTGAGPALQDAAARADLLVLAAPRSADLTDDGCEGLGEAVLRHARCPVAFTR